MKTLGFSETAPPIADFLRQLYQLEGQWLVCEPVYWEASHNDALIMADARMLQIPHIQSLALFKKIEKFLGEDGFSMHYHDAYTWLIRVDGRPPLNSLPTHAMLYRSQMAALKDLDASLYWQKLMTELQMYLKSEEQASLPVNGFWFYGYDSFYGKGRQSLLTDNLQWIAAFPEHVKPLDPTKPLEKKDIVWIENKGEGQLNTVINQVLGMIRKKHAARWFWNNMTYVTQGRPWWRSWMNRSS